MWFGGHRYNECKMNLWRKSEYVACDIWFGVCHYNEFKMNLCGLVDTIIMSAI
jgi:hypothetical protein